MLCYQVLEGGCSCLIGGVLLCSVTKSLKEAAAVWLVEFSCATLTKSLKEAAAVWLVEFSCATLTKFLKELTLHGSSQP